MAITTVFLRSRLTRDTVSSIIDTFLGSRFAVGSSKSKSSVLSTSALARETLCCSPPESFFAKRFS